MTCHQLAICPAEQVKQVPSSISCIVQAPSSLHTTRKFLVMELYSFLEVVNIPCELCKAC